MPKMKTKKALVKRIKVTASGKIMRRRKVRGKLTKRRRVRKSEHGQLVELHKSHRKAVKRMMPGV